MIKATNEQLINSVFNGRIPFFQCKEIDPYTKEVTLFDRDETEIDVTVTLWILGKRDFCVTITNGDAIIIEKQFNDIAFAWHAYKLQTEDNTSYV